MQLNQELVLFARQSPANCHGGPGGRYRLGQGAPTFRADLLLLRANPRDGIRHLLDECCVAPPLSAKAAAAR